LEQNCDQAIDRSTDWTGIYCRFLSFAIVDPIFHAERFNKLPVAFLQVCLENLFEARKEQVNAESISTAKLSGLVFSALGGKSKKLNLQDFLPYEIKKSPSDLQDETIEAMKWALKNEKMPPAIIGLIGAELG
jgi:hypothetical protein